MENGYEGTLAENFSGLAVNQHNQQHPQPHGQSNSSSKNNDSLYKVIKAVEAAEVTINQQVEENDRLRSELQRKTQELEKYKQDESMDPRYNPAAPWKEQGQGSYEARQSVPSAHDQEDMFKAKARSNAEGHSENSKMNGSLRDDQLVADNTGISPFSSSSTRPFSPSRHLKEGDHDHGLNLSGQGLMPLAEINNSNSQWKQDLAIKIREHEEEIMQLRRHLADYSIKEAQIHNEKYVLEKRIAYMRLAFDQQQQDLVDAASKALSYRQEIIEENIRLTYALQDAHQERTAFVSSLLPLLAEYSLQPPVLDAQSIVSNVKVLFKHLQEKLLLTESKLKETQYQLTPWRSDVNVAPQSPSHSIGATLTTSNKNGLELLPQPRYQVKTPVSVDSPDWDILSRPQSGLADAGAKNVDADELGRYSPLASRNASTQDIPTDLVVTQNDAHPVLYGEEMTNRQVTFHVPVSNHEVDDPDGDGNQNERDSSVNWNSGNSPYTTTVDDPSSSFPPYLPPVLEEPSSSFSEAADDDPLPAIEGLQILGEAFPGRELQACGYSIYGTTSCNFEWIRHLEDGSFTYIDGAKQPNYLVTADDVDKCLAIEVQPLDDRKRKGEPVKVFANDNKKITCDLEMQNHIEKTFTSGHASYKVSVSIGYLDIWEPATLAIMREGYNIKCSGPSGVVVTEKFSPSTSVVISYGQVSEFSITGSNGDEHLLRTESNPTDVSSSRDTIVLTFRLFIRRLVNPSHPIVIQERRLSHVTRARCYRLILESGFDTDIRAHKLLKFQTAMERKRGKKKVFFFNK